MKKLKMIFKAKQKEYEIYGNELDLKLTAALLIENLGSVEWVRIYDGKDLICYGDDETDRELVSGL